jgi:hypothetical protein
VIQQNKDTVIRLRTTRAMTLCVEPWGNEVQCSPGVTLESSGQGPKQGALEIEVDVDTITVYGWPGSIVTVLRDGVALV